MRFRLIFLILFYSQISAQTTFYVKYTTSDYAKIALSQAKVILKSTNQLLTKEKRKSFKVTSLKSQFGELNQNLDRIIKYDIYSSESLDLFNSSIKNSSSIEYIHTSGKYFIDNNPSDSLFSEQWGLKSVNAIQAWELIPEDSKEIIVAVIDTGIDYLHPDLKNVLFKNAGELGIDNLGNDKSTNGLDDDKNGFVDDFQGWDFVDKINIFPAELNADFTDWDNDPLDEHGHGTNISGVIGAEHNEIGIAGANPNVKILNLRAFDKNGTGEEDDAAAAIIYAVKMGAKIINMSWGDSQYSELLKDVVNYAYENGVVLVGSSGNNSTDSPHYPSGFSNVVSIGAIQENNIKASFSNYGSTLDLVAPGSQIITTNLNGTYKTVSGTSVSAPFVSAAAAMLKGIEEFSNEEIKQILKSTAKDLGDDGWDNLYGAGNLDMEKALNILSPSTIKFNSPSQNFYTSSDSLLMNITCLSPYFKNYQLSLGIGDNPANWEILQTGREEFQIRAEDVLILNIADFADSSYTLRLVVNRIDGKTQEERITFGVDRSPPNIIVNNISNALLNQIETVQASIVTDDFSSAKLYYREANSNNEFEFILLDGFNNNISTISDKHFGFIPTDKISSEFDFEFYFEITNLAGLSSKLFDGSEYFRLSNSIRNTEITNIKKAYTLPEGRIFEKPVSLGNSERFVLLNASNSSANLGIYRFKQDKFIKENELKNKIPISINDLNGDNKQDILNLYVKNGYIDSQSEIGETVFANKFTDSSQTFWPAYSDDIDNDGNYEIIVFSSDTTITIWEADSDLNLTEEATLELQSNNSSFFRNNILLVDNFDDDPNYEIVTVDNFGRLIIFEIKGSNLYSNDKIVEYFLPTDSRAAIAKGDYNGDGQMDIGILLNFEENIFLTPLIYSSVISLHNSGVNYLFENTFISTENNFIGAFEKQYNAINFEDVNKNGSQDLILFTFPNSYIFEYGEVFTNQLFYQTNVNSQAIFVGDLDGNGINEIGIPNTDSIYFHEFMDDGFIASPIISDYYSQTENEVYFEWTSNNLSTYIFRSSDNLNYSLIDSTNSNSYNDYVEANKNYYYTIQYYDSLQNSPISSKSKIISVFSHNPGKFLEIQLLNTKTLKISFSLPIDSDKLKPLNFIFNNKMSPSSYTLVDPSTILLNTENQLSIGPHDLFIKNVRDIYNTPFTDTLVQFDITENISSEESLFIKSYAIIDNYNLIITYNFDLDSLTALNINNYIFRPNNLIKAVRFYNNDTKSVKITSTKPFGSIGKEYILKVENIFSSLSSGYLPISEFSGSEIVLTSNANNLDDIYVYPNPVGLGIHQIITFANLPPRVEIHIFSIDGMFIKKITEQDGNGGVSWNMKDENNEVIGSGIYFYKAISLDDLNNNLQEKIGKFAVLK